VHALPTHFDQTGYGGERHLLDKRPHEHLEQQ
jgi:hypothetical protein